MKLDIGIAVVVVAVLIFYLRLIGLQRERARRVRAAAIIAKKPPARGKSPAAPPPDFSILSRSRADRVIAGCGLLAVLLGVALNAGWLPIQALQSLWWIPTALGVVAFSWAFKVQADPHE
jgi:hypothetical protein